MPAEIARANVRIPSAARTATQFLMAQADRPWTPGQVREYARSCILAANSLIGPDGLTQAATAAFTDQVLADVEHRTHASESAADCAACNVEINQTGDVTA